jgi:hypothetical protein
MEAGRLSFGGIIGPKLMFTAPQKRIISWVDFEIGDSTLSHEFSGCRLLPGSLPQWEHRQTTIGSE